MTINEKNRRKNLIKDKLLDVFYFRFSTDSKSSLMSASRLEEIHKLIFEGSGDSARDLYDYYKEYEDDLIIAYNEMFGGVA